MVESVQGPRIHNSLPSNGSLRALALFVLFPALFHGQPATLAAEQPHGDLRGIVAVYVLVEAFNNDPGAQKIGLTENIIRLDTERELKHADMRVLSEEQDGRGSPVLYIAVNILPDASAAGISLQLRQDASLYRDSRIVAPMASTWQTSILLSNANRSLVRNALKDELNHFLNVWRAANPRKK